MSRCDERLKARVEGKWCKELNPEPTRSLSLCFQLDFPHRKKKDKGKKGGTLKGELKMDGDDSSFKQPPVESPRAGMHVRTQSPRPSAAGGRRLSMSPVPDSLYVLFLCVCTFTNTHKRAHTHTHIHAG
jgi:hypothetical protein